MKSSSELWEECWKSVTLNFSCDGFDWKTRVRCFNSHGERLSENLTRDWLYTLTSDEKWWTSSTKKKNQRTLRSMRNIKHKPLFFNDLVWKTGKSTYGHQTDPNLLKLTHCWQRTVGKFYTSLSTEKTYNTFDFNIKPPFPRLWWWLSLKLSKRQ